MCDNQTICHTLIYNCKVLNHNLSYMSLYLLAQKDPSFVMVVHEDNPLFLILLMVLSVTLTVDWYKCICCFR